MEGEISGNVGGKETEVIFPSVVQLLQQAVWCSVVFSIVNLSSSLIFLLVLMALTVIVGSPTYCILMCVPLLQKFLKTVSFPQFIFG